MLNEIYVLANALQKAGLSVEPQHPRVSPPGKSGPAFYVRLDVGGHVTGIDRVTDDEWRGLWTIKEGNQNSFPVVRPAQPLLDIAAESWHRVAAEIAPKGTINTVGRLAEKVMKFEIAPVTVDKQLFARLCVKAGELRDSVAGRQEVGHVQAMATRFLLAMQSPDRMRLELVRALLSRLQAGDLVDLVAARDLLIGKQFSEKKQRAETTAQLAFDVDDSGASVYDLSVRRVVENVLPFEVHDEVTSSHPAPISAYGGSTDLQVSAFPKVRLPVLNKDIPLFSMFSEAECNHRYGLTDSTIVAVSRDEARRMQDALTHIVDPERQGRTWRAVVSGQFEQVGGRKREKQDLLIAYVDGRPEIPVATVNLFGAEDLTEKQYEVDAAAVCQALEAIVQKEPLSRLNLFIIRRASEGQAHVALAESPTVRSVLDGARWWQRAATNVPAVRGPAQAQVPYPDQVVRLLSKEWMSNGKRPVDVVGPALRDVLAIMLRTSATWELSAENLLALAIRRASSLLVGVGGAPDAYQARDRQTALVHVGILGILLDALGRKKEAYMDSAAFLMGRVLAFADTLHRSYCLEVRKGEIPPQLVGNALMMVARSSPQEALDRLGERIGVYAAWASTAGTDGRSGSGARLGKWALAQLGKTSHKLSLGTVPAEMSQQDRAELLLGYLARPPLDSADEGARTPDAKEDGHD